MSQVLIFTTLWFYPGQNNICSTWFRILWTKSHNHVLNSKKFRCIVFKTRVYFMTLTNSTFSDFWSQCAAGRISNVTWIIQAHTCSLSRCLVHIILCQVMKSFLCISVIRNLRSQFRKKQGLRPQWHHQICLILLICCAPLNFDDFLI
jgi:hypothetical protein